MSENRIFAIIPAAGKSERMGRPKLTLPLGSRRVIEQVIEALHRADVQNVLVVAAPDADELAALATAAGAQVHILPEPTPDMRATVLEGLGWMERHWQPRNDDAWLLVPADHPTVQPAVVRSLVGARATQPQASIFVPAHLGRRGHPTLIDWHHVARLRQAPSNQGLNAYFRRHGDETIELPWPTPEILWDLDTPEDYRRLTEWAMHHKA